MASLNILTLLTAPQIKPADRQVGPLFLERPGRDLMLKIYVLGSRTQSSVSAQLLVDLLHPLDVEPARLCVVHHGLRVMDSDDALGRCLHGLWSVPRVIDELSRKTSEDR